MGRVLMVLARQMGASSVPSGQSLTLTKNSATPGTGPAWTLARPALATHGAAGWLLIGSASNI